MCTYRYLFVDLTDSASTDDNAVTNDVTGCSQGGKKIKAPFILPVARHAVFCTVALFCHLKSKARQQIKYRHKKGLTRDIVDVSTVTDDLECHVCVF